MSVSPLLILLILTGCAHSPTNATSSLGPAPSPVAPPNPAPSSYSTSPPPEVSPSQHVRFVSTALDSQCWLSHTIDCQLGHVAFTLQAHEPLSIVVESIFVRGSFDDVDWQQNADGHAGAEWQQVHGAFIWSTNGTALDGTVVQVAAEHELQARVIFDSLRVPDGSTIRTVLRIDGEQVVLESHYVEWTESLEPEEY